MRRSLRGLDREGFATYSFSLLRKKSSPFQLSGSPCGITSNVNIGPFDIIGDVHGCSDELGTLFEKLGYTVDGDQVTPPEGRKAVFLGDLVDRGPKSPRSFSLR